MFKTRLLSGNTIGDHCAHYGDFRRRDLVRGRAGDQFDRHDGNIPGISDTKEPLGLCGYVFAILYYAALYVKPLMKGHAADVFFITVRSIAHLFNGSNGILLIRNIGQNR